MGGIEVRRPKGKGLLRRDMIRRYKIFVDDVHVGSLREGETYSGKFDPGEHRIQAKIDWAGSPVVEVSLSDEVVHFVVRPGGGASEFHQAFTEPERYLVLEPT